MEEKTIEISIPWLLPGIENEQDRCLERLADQLSAGRGIRRAHLERGKSPAGLCLHYDPDQVSIEDVRMMAKRAGDGILSRFRHRILALDGLDCSDCALVLEHSLARMDGVLDVNVDYSIQTLGIEFDSQRTSQRAIVKRIEQLGYQVLDRGLSRWLKNNHELLFSLLSGLALLLAWSGEHMLGLTSVSILFLYLAAFLLGGFDAARHAIHNLWQRRLDTHLLMITAALGAASLGSFAEGALLLFLFSLGHALEEQVLGRAHRAVRSLADLAPKSALVRFNGEEKSIPVEQLSIGDWVIVRPGERVPVDGEVISGQTAVDQSPVTGESLPVIKTPGQQVFAGTVNGEGAIEVRVNRLARDSTLSRVMQMVEKAQEQKSPTQQVTEKFMRHFVPAVLVASLLLILLPPLFGVPFFVSFTRAMTLLVAASPCALALGTPAAVLAGIAQAARNGVLVKGGAHLETLGRLKAVAFDKTGTLTQGKMQVVQVIAYEGKPRAEVLALAAAVESQSAHPLAQAVVEAAAADQDAVGARSALPPVQDLQSLPGRGIRARMGDQIVWIGSLRLVEEAGIPVGQPARQDVQSLEDQGMSVLAVGLEGRLVGLLGATDAVRSGAQLAIYSLKEMGISPLVMLSGDHPAAVEAIAGRLGLDDFQAGLLPEDKVRAVHRLIAENGATAMVGDGVNDAPALAKASLGIAMGGASTAAALETADVALMGSDLSKLPFAVGLGRASRRVIIQNLVISLVVIAALGGLALAGLAEIGMAIIIHEGSTLLVALNAIRLLQYRQG